MSLFIKFSLKLLNDLFNSQQKNILYVYKTIVKEEEDSF